MGKNLENDYIGNEKGKCLNLWCPLMQDIKIMKASVEVIERYLHGFTLLPNRDKRSVLTIMGKALNVLFGTITEEELDVLERRLKASEKGQLELAQVEKDSMTILNITRVELADNHRNINELVEGFKKMQVELGNITEDPSDKTGRLHKEISSVFNNRRTIAEKVASLVRLHMEFASPV